MFRVIRHAWHTYFTDSLHADEQTVVAIVTDASILPVKGIVGEARKILEGRIEYAFKTTSHEAFVVTEDAFSPEERYWDHLEPSMVYHFDRAESRDAFAAWKENVTDS